MLVYRRVFNYIQLTKIRDESLWINQTFPAHESLIKQHLAHNRVTLGFSGLGEGWKYGLFHWISPLHEIKSQSLQVLKKRWTQLDIYICIYIYIHMFTIFTCAARSTRLTCFGVSGFSTYEAWPLGAGRHGHRGHKNVDLPFKNGDFPKLC